MEDIVSAIFTHEVIAQLAKVYEPARRCGTQGLHNDTGTSSSGRRLSRGRLDTETWAKYLRAAHACAMLTPKFKRTLTSERHDDFHGAMAECHAAWFLGDKLGLEVERGTRHERHPDPLEAGVTDGPPSHSDTAPCGTVP